MTRELKVPRLAESISEAVVVAWIKPDGSEVRVDEPVVTLETDKAAVEIPSEFAGTLRHARAVGERVEVGDVLARIEESAAGEAIISGARGAPDPMPASGPDPAVARATPAAAAPPPAPPSGAPPSVAPPSGAPSEVAPPGDRPL